MLKSPPFCHNHHAIPAMIAAATALAHQPRSLDPSASPTWWPARKNGKNTMVRDSDRK